MNVSGFLNLLKVVLNFAIPHFRFYAAYREGHEVGETAPCTIFTAKCSKETKVCVVEKVQQSYKEADNCHQDQAQDSH